MQFQGHIPVMFEECMNALDIKPDGIYLDMTLGGFGHGRGICEKLNENGIYIGLDLDEAAIKRGYERSAELKNKCYFVHSNYKDFRKVLDDLKIEAVDGILVDLGVSSFQLDESERGFSFRNDGPLSALRMLSMNTMKASLKELSLSTAKNVLLRRSQEGSLREERRRRLRERRI